MSGLSGFVARETFKELSNMAAMRRFVIASGENLARHRFRRSFDLARSEVRKLRRYHKLGIL